MLENSVRYIQIKKEFIFTWFDDEASASVLYSFTIIVNVLHLNYTYKHCKLYSYINILYKNYLNYMN